MTPYRTVLQIAKQEGVARPTVYNWLYTGQLEGTRVGAQWRVTTDQWNAFLERCMNKKEVAKAVGQ